MCLAVMMLTGLARFSGKVITPGVWLDALFLISAGVCLALLVLRLGRGLRETTERHIAEEEQEQIERAAGRGGADSPTRSPDDNR